MHTRTIVYFDGLCKVCSFEIEQYKKAKGGNDLEYIDIMSPGFSAELHKLDPSKVHKVMHVRDQSGKLRQGVDAFIAIWESLPGYNWLARAARNPLARAFLNSGYSFFTVIRPYLPRRKDLNCDASPYCDLNQQKGVQK